MSRRSRTCLSNMPRPSGISVPPRKSPGTPPPATRLPRICARRSSTTGHSSLTCSQISARQRPGVALCRLVWRPPGTTIAARRVTWLGDCARWLPLWLPKLGPPTKRARKSDSLIEHRLALAAGTFSQGRRRNSPTSNAHVLRPCRLAKAGRRDRGGRRRVLPPCNPAPVPPCGACRRNRRLE